MQVQNIGQDAPERFILAQDIPAVLGDIFNAPLETNRENGILARGFDT